MIIADPAGQTEAGGLEKNNRASTPASSIITTLFSISHLLPVAHSVVHNTKFARRKSSPALIPGGGDRR
jgi:hypothetical protein